MRLRRCASYRCSGQASIRVRLAFGDPGGFPGSHEGPSAAGHSSTATPKSSPAASALPAPVARAGAFARVESPPLAAALVEVLEGASRARLDAPDRRGWPAAAREPPADAIEAPCRYAPLSRVTAENNTCFCFLRRGPGPSDRPGGGVVNETSISLRPVLSGVRNERAEPRPKERKGTVSSLDIGRFQRGQKTFRKTFRQASAGPTCQHVANI